MQPAPAGTELLKFLGTPKNELVHYRRYAMRAQVQTEIAKYIELFNNH